MRLLLAFIVLLAVVADAQKGKGKKKNKGKKSVWGKAANKVGKAAKKVGKAVKKVDDAINDAVEKADELINGNVQRIDPNFGAAPAKPIAPKPVDPKPVAPKPVDPKPIAPKPVDPIRKPVDPVRKPVVKKTIEVKCIPMPTKSKAAPWPKQPSDTILDFDKLEEIKKNIEKRNEEIKKKQKPATLLSLADLKAKFSDRLAAQFKDFSMADMKKRKTMKIFKKAM
jgi:predicted Holliday junction resolvase-like endonuclease